MRTSVEQEAEILERQEKEFHNAMDESEENVLGHGISLATEETEARETQDKIQPPDQTADT